MKTFFALLLLLAVLVLARVSRAQPVGLGSRSPAAGEVTVRIRLLDNPDLAPPACGGCPAGIAISVVARSPFNALAYQA